MRYHFMRIDEKIEKITNGLGQEITKGDIILCFSSYSICPMVVTKANPRLSYKGDNLSPRYVRVQGLKIHGFIPQQYDYNQRKMVVTGEYKVEARKGSISGGFNMLKVRLEDLITFNVHPDVIRLCHETVGRVLNNEYDKKRKTSKA